MRIAKTLAALAVPLAALTLAAPASAQEAHSGSFSVLSYNIAGLPAWMQDGDPEHNTPVIGSRLGPYDIVHVQEDFNYHASLYAADEHPHRTPTSGGVPFGSGLNTLANFEYTEFHRVTWDDCYINQADCLTPKGFTFMRLRLADGAEVDLYNLHADAGGDQGDFDARASNYEQLTEYIGARSADRAVIVFGDTNTRYTTPDDRIAEFAAANGLSDPWVDLVRGGDAPDKGEPSLGCGDADIDETCEVVDKVFYRSGGGVILSAVEYRNDNADFRRDDGGRLSDHYPIAVEFEWSLGA